MRANEHLEKIEAENEAKRVELGVSDDLREVAGITTAMMVALGNNDVKSLEDLAGCATDDLVGYTEGRGADAVRHAGFLDGFELSRTDAEAMIMDARVRAGWIEAPAAEEEFVEDEAYAEDVPADADGSAATSS